MDYEIDLSTLSSKQTDLEALKTASEDIYNEFNSSSINELLGTEISNINTKLKESITRLKQGYANCNNWYKRYVKELNDVENNLSTFNVDGLEPPKEFLGEFPNLFGKNTIPSLKTKEQPKVEEPATPQVEQTTLGNTQASSFYELGNRAYNEWQPYTEDSARGEWIRKVGAIVQKTNTYGIKKSLILAQIINESGWMSEHASSLSNYNNVLGINTDMGRVKPEMQTSVWSQKRTSGINTVTQWDSTGTHIIPSNESMRHYDSIEECIEDYANVVSIYHPECVGSNNLNDYHSFLEGYTPNPNGSTTEKYRGIIEKYNLERFDV